MSSRQLELRAGVGELGLHRPNPALSLFLQTKFYWHAAMHIGLHIVCGCFHPMRAELSRCIRDPDTPWHTKPKIFFSRDFYRKSLLSPVLEHSGEVWVIGSHVEFKQPSGWIKTVLGGVSEKKKGQGQSPETDMASCGFCARGSSPGHSNSFYSPDNFTAVLFVYVGGGGGKLLLL